MGYLNSTTVTVDAILTKKGRQLLAANDGSFVITQFALSDDEVDYTTYNPNHPSGSAFYGEAIEAMPVIEAFPDEAQIMRYKLVTLPRGTSKMPVISLGSSSIILKQGASLSITPQTLNYLGANTYEPSGYAATISDIRLMSTFEGVGVNTPAVDALNIANQTTTIGILVVLFVPFAFSKISPEEFEKEQEKKRINGLEAEKFVVDFEKKRLSCIILCIIRIVQY